MCASSLATLGLHLCLWASEPDLAWSAGSPPAMAACYARPKETIGSLARRGAPVWCGIRWWKSVAEEIAGSLGGRVRAWC